MSFVNNQKRVGNVATSKQLARNKPSRFKRVMTVLDGMNFTLSTASISILCFLADSDYHRWMELREAHSARAFVE